VNGFLHTAPRALVTVRLSVETLGTCAFVVHGPLGAVPLVLKNQKHRALLAFIALSDAKLESRERLVNLLWAGAETVVKARHSLRTALLEINKSLEATGFTGFDSTSSRTHIALDHSRVNCDVKDILSQLNQGRITAHLTREDRVFDRLLEDLQHISEEFGVWVQAKRGTLQQFVPRLLDELMDDASRPAKLRIDAARALHSLETANEKAVRTLMVAKAAAGDATGALNLYQSLRSHVIETYDWEPDEVTQGIYGDIKMGRIGAQRPDAGAAPVPQVNKTRLIIGVSLFNLAGIPETTHSLVDGFRRELVGSLLKFREWDVRETAAPPDPQAAASLAANEYVIDASGIQAGGSVRLVLMLRDVATGQYIWSQKLLLSIESWFADQDQIVRNVAMALGVHISSERLALLNRAPRDVTPHAYDVCYQVLDDLNSREAKRWESAAVTLRKLIAAEPQFARAFANLATLNNLKHFAFPGTMRDLVRITEAIEHSRKAIILDPLDSRCQLALGYSLAIGGQYDLAAAHFKLAQDLNDSDPWVSLSSITGLALCGDVSTSLVALEHFIQRSPIMTQAHWGYAATIYMLAGDHAAVLRMGPKAPDPPYMPLLTASAAAHLGQTDRAKQIVDSFFQRVRKNWHGPGKPTSAAISAWALQMMPVRDTRIWTSLRDGFDAAGGACAQVTKDSWPKTLAAIDQCD
jgi:DNA-binding SARP family transcriptional activator